MSEQNLSQDKKRIAVLAGENYQTLEAWYPILRLREAGHLVDVIGRDEGCSVCPSKCGYELEVDYPASSIDPDNYDGVVVPGGYAPDKLRRDEGVLELVSYLHENDRLVAAICHAGWVLISADVLSEATVTSVSAIRDDIENAGAEWVDEEVVVDENLITSRQPDDLPAFMQEILEFLEA